jgi:hypothetical protein
LETRGRGKEGMVKWWQEGLGRKEGGWRGDVGRRNEKEGRRKEEGGRREEEI